MAALAIAGCVTGGVPPATGSPWLITPEEVRAETNVSSAYGIISRLRPNWLRTRGVNSFDNPVAISPEVYLNGTHYGPVSSLNSILPESVLEIQYLSATEATTRFGPGHLGGAILVSVRVR